MCRSSGILGRVSEGQIPAGWYPDERNGGVRYWDGQQWTEHHQPDQAVTPAYGPGYGQPYGQQSFGQQPYGQPYVKPYGAVAKQSNTLSVIGIVLGAVAFLLLPPLFGLAGIVLGIIAMVRKERLGWVALVVSIAGLIGGMVIGAVVFSAVYN